MTESRMAKNRWRSSGWAEMPFFLAAARSGSLRKAADALGVNHATVNSNITQLETHYGARLFDRTPRGLILTDTGRQLLKRAEDAEQSMISGRRVVSGQDSRLAGPVHLNISAWNAYYILARELPRFFALYPDIDLTISVTDRVERMARSEIDVIWRVAWSVDDDVVGRKVYDYHAAVLASQSYLDRQWEKRGPNGEGLHWIGQETLWPNPQLDRATLFPKAMSVYNVEDPILINEMLKDGMGMIIAPLVTLKALPDISIVPGTPIVPDRCGWVLLQSDLRHTARVRALVDFLVETARSFVRWDAEFAKNYRP